MATPAVEERNEASVNVEPVSPRFGKARIKEQGDFLLVGLRH